MPNIGPNGIELELAGGGGGGAYIPLAGTTVGNPVTGSIKVYDGFQLVHNNGVSIYDNSYLTLANGYTELYSYDSITQYLSTCLITTDGIALRMQKTAGESVGISINPEANGASGINIFDSKATARGLKGQQNFTPNITALDYTQKIYVDTKEPLLGNPAANGYVLSSLTDGTRSWVAPGGGGGSDATTASNGLTEVGDNIKLGGTLTESTTIDGDIYDLRVFNNSTDHSLWVNNSGSGSGIIVAANNNAIYATCAFNPVIVSKQTNGSNGIQSWTSQDYSAIGESLQLFGGVNVGAPNSNLGTSIAFNLQSSTGIPRYTNRIISKWINATDEARTSQIIIGGIDNATENTLLSISGNGATKLNQYGVGTFTGTPVYSLATDASGNIIETALGGGGGTDTNFATSNLTATGGRIHDFVANSLEIRNMSELNLKVSNQTVPSANNYLYITPSDFSLEYSQGSGAPKSIIYGDDFEVLMSNSRQGVITGANINFGSVNIKPGSFYSPNASISFTTSKGDGSRSDYWLPFKATTTGVSSYIPLTVNNQEADSNGNISITTTGAYIPLAGTVSGSEVTGAVVFGAASPFTISNLGGTEDGGFLKWESPTFNTVSTYAFTASSTSITHSDTNAPEYARLSVLSSEVRIDAPITSSGLKGMADFTANITDLDYTQKKYVGYRGTSTLVAGTVTVSAADVKTGMKIYVSVNAPSGTQGFLSAPTSSIVNDTSFIINSTSATETSTVNWWIVL